MLSHLKVVVGKGLASGLILYSNILCIVLLLIHATLCKATKIETT